jgi:F-box interacting protein
MDVAYGLVYSSASSEYKVVRIFSDDEDTGAAPWCEVFVLGTPAYWRPTAQQPPLCIVDEEESAVFLNGRLHFLRLDGAILTLDINDETFASLPPPAASPPAQFDIWVTMTELDGCLCVCHGGDMTAGLYRIWLLRDHDAQQWELLCCIDPSAWSEPERMLLQPPCWIGPIRMHNSNNGKRMIMFGTGSRKVLTIDPHVGTPGILCKLETGKCNRSLAPAPFEESLVSVGRTIEEMVFSSPSTKAWSDVLKWLPARSVVELSLVCREWRALINTDRFIRSHAIHANLINRPPSLKFVMDRSFGSFVNVDGIRPTLLPETTSEPFECSQPCHGLNVGNCNGSEFVCNPAIGYHAFLRDQQDSPPFAYIPLGLGYNSDVNDHVLVYLSYTKKNLETGEYAMDCYMRHLQNQSCEWIKIDPPSRPVADIRPAYIKGKIYWIVEPQPVLKSSPACELVVCNTTMGGKFEVLQGPSCKHDNGRMSILELHGAICVTCSNRDTDTIDVWMMRDNQAWSVEYRIELGLFLPEYTSDMTTIMGINPVDGRILLNTGRSLGYYDPKTVTLETIYTLDRPQDNQKFCVIMCQESLLLPHSQPF